MTPLFFYRNSGLLMGQLEPTGSYQDIASPPCGHFGVLLNKPATYGSLLKV